MAAPTILFSSRVDWSEGWKETLAWLTDVQTADDDSEQRISHRSVPRRTLAFSAKAHRSREAALLASLVWANQPEPIGFPVWPDALWIAAPVSIGDTSLAVDTSLGGVANREFVADGFLALWLDPFTWEIRTVSSVTAPGTIAIDALAKDWPLGTVIVPVTVATLRGQMQGKRSSSVISQLAIEADCDVLADTAMVAAAPWSGVQFQGLDLLTTMPDGRSPQKTTVHRTMIREDSDTGVFGYLAPTTVPVPTRDFDRFLKGRATIAQFKGFLANRVGRYIAFWAPTWRQDLELAVPAAATDTTLTIKSCGYTAYVFPSAPVRAVLALIAGGPTVTPATVTAAVDNGDGTETLTLSSPAGVALPVDGMVSYLTPVRLESDSVTIAYAHSEFARASTPLAEVPHDPIDAGAPGGGVVITPAAMARFGAALPKLNTGLAAVGFRVHRLVDDLWNATSDLVSFFENSGGAWFSNHLYFKLTSAGVVTFYAYDFNIGSLQSLFAVTLTDLPAADGTTFLWGWLDYDSGSAAYRWGLTGDDGTDYGHVYTTATGRYIGAESGQTSGVLTDPLNQVFTIASGVLSEAFPVARIDAAEAVAHTFADVTVLPVKSDSTRPGLWTFDTGTLNEYAGGTPLNIVDVDDNRVVETYEAGGTVGTA